MGPRSWRPDSSLGDTVDDSQVAAHLDDTVSTDVMQFLNPQTDENAEREATVAFSLSSKTPPGRATATPTPRSARNTARKNVNFSR